MIDILVKAWGELFLAQALKHILYVFNIADLACFAISLQSVLYPWCDVLAAHEALWRSDKDRRSSGLLVHIFEPLFLLF